MSLSVGLILLAVLTYIGISYGVMWYKYCQMKNCLSEEDYYPSRYIFLQKPDSKKMQELVDMCISSYRKAGFLIIKDSKRRGCRTIQFSNTSEVVIYDEDAPIDRLSEHQIKHFVHKVFIDSDLPDSAYRALIQELGLINHTITVALCAKDKELK